LDPIKIIADRSCQFYYLMLQLVFQVKDHLEKVAKHINVRVTAIVGGILPEKQERLLKARSEIVVATPGRLWELMSSGETHLTEVIANAKLY
jgi:ATP-dependent RNA helicase DDX24/MAK5